MMNARFSVPTPVNEPILSYAPDSAERQRLKAKPQELGQGGLDIPMVNGAKEAKAAVDAALKARREWAATPWHERAAVFLRAAELLAGPYRPVLNAATMLCQSKNAYQAEIDAACELIDFWRFNVHYAEQI